MEENLLDIGYRRKLIQEIKSDENVQRKIVSYKKANMQQDNFYQYVKEYLESKLDPQTVKEMNIFASINLQRRISKAEASIYKKAPKRLVTVDGNVIEEFDDIYYHLNLNQKLREANEKYKYDGQCTLQFYPQSGKIKCRVLLPYMFDVVPDSKNPENAEIYIISNFNNTSRDKIRRDNGGDRTGFSQGDKYRDSINQAIADYDDQNKAKERYYVWSKSLNFVMDGNGNFLDKETETEIIRDIDESNKYQIESPLKEYQCLPFVDVSAPKNLEYWVRGHDSLYDATILYNVILTSEFSTVEMQGHAQPFYKGSAEHLPENLRVGVDKLIFIPVDPNNPVNSEFGFANPGSDLGGIREFRESFLMAFLSSRGLDASIVSGNVQSSTASSGVEKLLQMIEKFDASQEDLSLFEMVEEECLKVIACWIKAYYGVLTDGQPILNSVFQVQLPQDQNDLSLNVQFAKPEMIKTEMEMLEIAQKEIEMGISSRVHVLMDLKNMTKEDAIKHIQVVEELEGLNGNNQSTENI